MCSSEVDGFNQSCGNKVNTAVTEQSRSVLGGIRLSTLIQRIRLKMSAVQYSQRKVSRLVAVYAAVLR